MFSEFPLFSYIFPLCHLIVITYSSEDAISINQYVVLENKHEHSDRASSEVSLCVSGVKALFWVAEYQKRTGKSRKVCFQTPWFRLYSFFSVRVGKCSVAVQPCSVSVPSKIEYCIMRWLAVRLEMDSAGICHKLPNNEVIFSNVLGILICFPALFSGRHLHQNLPESVRSLLLSQSKEGRKWFWK